MPVSQLVDDTRFCSTNRRTVHMGLATPSNTKEFYLFGPDYLDEVRCWWLRAGREFGFVCT